MSEAIKFPVNPELGKYYNVPCIKNMRGEYWPVNSHLHDDKKVINFPEKHWHVDWRFVSTYKWDCEIGGGGSISVNEARRVIVLFSENPNFYHNQFVATSVNVVYKRLRCLRLYSTPTYWNDRNRIKVDRDWPEKLQVKFCQSQLKHVGDQLICPHKGIAIMIDSLDDYRIVHSNRPDTSPE